MSLSRETRRPPQAAGWRYLQGILVGFGALITAIAGLIAALR